MRHAFRSLISVLCFSLGCALPIACVAQGGFALDPRRQRERGALNRGYSDLFDRAKPSFSHTENLMQFQALQKFRETQQSLFKTAYDVFTKEIEIVRDGARVLENFKAGKYVSKVTKVEKDTLEVLRRYLLRFEETEQRREYAQQNVYGSMKYQLAASERFLFHTTQFTVSSLLARTDINYQLLFGSEEGYEVAMRVGLDPFESRLPSANREIDQFNLATNSKIKKYLEEAIQSPEIFKSFGIVNAFDQRLKDALSQYNGFPIAGRSRDQLDKIYTDALFRMRWSLSGAYREIQGVGGFAQVGVNVSQLVRFRKHCPGGGINVLLYGQYVDRNGRNGLSRASALRLGGNVTWMDRIPYEELEKATPERIVLEGQNVQVWRQQIGLDINGESAISPFSATLFYRLRDPKTYLEGSVFASYADLRAGVQRVNGLPIAVQTDQWFFGFSIGQTFH